METDEHTELVLEEIEIGDRARENLGDIQALQTSIEKRGLLHPIIVSRETKKLVAGFRRLICHRNLGLKKILVRFKEDLSEIEMKILELEENLHKPLEWNEAAALRARIHELWQQERGKAMTGHKGRGQSLEDSAEALCISVATLSQDIALVQAMEIVPKLAEFTSKKQALKSLDKMKEIAILTELARRDMEEQRAAGDLPYSIACGDGRKLIKKNIESGTIDLVVFDPPWGIEIDKKGTSRGPRGEKVFYDDSPEKAVPFTMELLPEIHRVLKDDTHMYMFIGAQYRYFWTCFLTNMIPIIEIGKPVRFETLTEGRDWSFTVRPFSLIWIKEGGGYTDYETKFMPRYEEILFCQKGQRPLNYPSDDTFIINRPLTTERIHPQQKPIDLIKEFIKISTNPNEVVLDPCFGSGTTIVSAIISGRRVIGYEDDKEMFLRAENWIQGIKIMEDEDESERQD